MEDDIERDFLLEDIAISWKLQRYDRRQVEWAIARNILSRGYGAYGRSRLFHLVICTRENWNSWPPLVPRRIVPLHPVSEFSNGSRRDATRRAVGLSPRNSAETARFQSTSAVIPTAVRAIFRKYWRAEGWKEGIGTHHGLIFFRPVGKDLLKFLCVSPGYRGDLTTTTTTITAGEKIITRFVVSWSFSCSHHFCVIKYSCWFPRSSLRLYGGGEV